MTTDDLKMQNGTKSTNFIEKEFVHKHFEENVFISRIEEASDRIFNAHGLLPKNHSLYNDQLSGLSACPYFIEISRQANMAICHLFFNVSLDANFTMISVDWDFSDKQPFLTKSFDPIINNVEFTTYKTRKNFTFVKILSHFYQKEYNFLNGASTFLFSTKNNDESKSDPKIKSFIQETQAVKSELVQVGHLENVLITRPELDETNKIIRAQMIVDANHTYFYEHPCVHVPGMMLLEAGKQLAIGGLKTQFDFLKGTYGDLKEGKIAFSNFATPHSEVFIEVKTQVPNVKEDHVHIPITVTYYQNKQQFGSIEGIAAFMDKKEALIKSIYTLGFK